MQGQPPQSTKEKRLWTIQLEKSLESCTQRYRINKDSDAKIDLGQEQASHQS